MSAATSNNPPSAARVPHRCRPFLAGAPSVIVGFRWVAGCGRISLSRSGPVNEDGPEIVDVGPGRPGDEQIPQAREKSGGIVVGKKRGSIEAKGPRPRHGAS